MPARLLRIPKIKMPEFRPNLETTLAIQQVKKDVYTNTQRLYVPPGSRGVFGGTLVSQSLWAAMKTVPDSFVPHSLHSYFINSGDGKKDILYHVERLRDGKSFISREVRAYQGETLVFIENVSFARLREEKKAQQLEHSGPMPPVDFGHFLEPYESYKRGVVDRGLLNEETSFDGDYFTRFAKGPLEYRFAPELWFTHEDHPDFEKDPHEVDVDWFVRVREPVQDPKFNYIALAYYSDSYLLLTVSKFHKRPMHSTIFSVSLDHSIYFHKQPQVNNWNMYHIEHPKSGDSRNLLYAAFYEKDSQELIASCVQEGLVLIDDNKLLNSKL
jgi:acyl-coenzyme A thioesterase 1/2/4